MEAILRQRMETMEAAFVAHEDGSLFVQLARTYREAGDGERTMRVLRRGTRAHPTYVPGIELLGDVLLQAGVHAEAAACYRRVLDLEPDHSAARAALDRIGAAGSDETGAVMPWDERAPAEPPMAEPPMPWEETPVAAARDRTPAHGEPLREGVPGSGNRPGHGERPDAEPGAPHPPAPEPRPAEETEVEPGAPSRPHGDPLREILPEKGSAQELVADAHPAGGGDSTTVALADLLVGLLEYRDPFFRGGTSMTRLLAAAIATELGLDRDAVHAIALGAVLRDLGQIPLKGLIDSPVTELGADDRRKLERHVDTALELLDDVRLPELSRQTIRHHHERWDGGGYPDGLERDMIPLGARIVAVADSFAAMIAARPHRLPKRVPAALEDIRSGSGEQYDPAVVDALVRVLSSTTWPGLPFGLRHHVLVVDPDETRAMVLATKLCSNGYLAEAAFSAATAGERLRRTRIVALIISSDLPGEDDALLMREVREAERHGLIPVLVTDAGVSERVALLHAGADVCLGRGVSFDEIKATLEALLRREGSVLPPGPEVKGNAPWAGLQGDIGDFPLTWLLQVLNYDARTAAVFLRGTAGEGAIYLERGNPRHAESGSLVGEDAFRAMLAWPSGSFSVDPEATTEEQSIRTPLMNLLLDDAVREDHAAFFGTVQV